MTANTKLIQAIADALFCEYGEEATEWLEHGGRANVERVLAEWRTAIEEGRWIERVEDVLVLRALRHEAHWVEVLGGPDAETLIREFVDEDWPARGVETATRIGEVFAHELLRGDTGEPFESIEYAFRELGDAIRGEDDEQPWNAAAPLSGAETRVEVCLAEARYVERRVPFVDLPGKVRHPRAIVNDPENADIPTNASALMALCGALYKLASDVNFDAIVTYAKRLRREVGESLVGACLRRTPSLQRSPGFIRWAAAKTQ